MEKLDGKTIWITGASSGIGEALAYRLSHKDCQLILSARDTEALRRVKERCRYPERARILPLDVTHFEAAPNMVAQALAMFGKIDVLVNNAGVSQRSHILETDFEVFRTLMDINYFGTVALTKALLPHFVANQGGHFVTVSSVMGKFGAPPRAGYCASKHALHGFFDVLRMEHEKDRIHVTIICPGYVRTDVDKNALTADGTPRGTRSEANQKGLSPDDLARRMVRAIEKRKYEAYFGGFEVLGVHIKRLFPKLLHKMVLRNVAKR